MFRFSSLALAVALFTGCVPSGAPDDLQLSVDLSSGTPVFSWADGVPVHQLAVVYAEDGAPLSCVDGQLEYDLVYNMWVARDSEDPIWEKEPALVSPLPYADPDTPSDPRRNAVDLELVPGMTYAAELELWEPDGEGSASLTGSGCVLFTAPG